MNVFSSKKPTQNSIENTTKEEHPFVEIVRFSIIAILIVIPVRMFIAQPFIVSGSSMDETFHSGDYLIVDQVTYHFEKPSRGDIIVFRYPKDPSKFFIKRVIGLPGDKITIENASVIIENGTHPNGFVLEEPYINEMTPDSPLIEELGDREYFVMGDNRDRSSDSRSWGVLQEERIIGRALIRLFPPNVIDYLPGAVTITEENEEPKTIVKNYH